MPKLLTQAAMLEVLAGQGFLGLYDFAYLPRDFKTMGNFGYAVVNFVTHEVAASAMQRFSGFAEWPVQRRRACTVVWNVPCQGLAAQIERYRDSPLMHPDVAEEYRPALFSCGVKSAFPPPTKQLKAPPRLPQRSAPRGKKPARTACFEGAAKA